MSHEELRHNLKDLLEIARRWRAENPVTPEEYRAQVISFAYGNVALHNPRITREMVEKAYDELHSSGGKE